MEITIHCQFDDMMSVSELKKKFHPHNTNHHPDDQIKQLAKIIKYQGIRWPVVISKQTGYITKGHGKVLAAKELGLNSFPVQYQEYEDMDQELADITSDNAIALWAELDLKHVNEIVQNLGPDFDIDLLGIKDFEIDFLDKHELEEEKKKEKEKSYELLVECVTEEERDSLYKELLDKGFMVNIK